MSKNREEDLGATTAEQLSRLAEEIRRGRRRVVSITVQKGERPDEAGCTQPGIFVERELDGSDLICIETQEQ